MERFDYDRYQTVYPIEVVLEWLYNEYDIDISKNIPLEENIEKFENLNEDDKKKITKVIKNLIKLNIDEFIWDW
jgi:hypothetical protein